MQRQIAWEGRVALIARPELDTGIGRYVQMLDRGLRDAGVDATRVEPTLPQLPDASYRALRLLGRDLDAFLRNYPLWTTYPDADVYHLTGQTLASLLLFRRPKGAVVVTVHDLFPYVLRNGTAGGALYGSDRTYYRLVIAGLKRADRLIANSAYTKQCIVDVLRIAPSKITVAYPGLDHELFQPLSAPDRIREKYRLAEGQRYLIYVGSEDPRKNLITLVRALAHIRRELPEVALIKVGRSHSEPERKRLLDVAAELGVREAIHFLEHVPDTDLPALYNLADVYVTPSVEGFGFPVLEAMACGTPVVCAKIGSAPEIVGDAGVQVSPFDSGAFATAVITLLGDVQRRLRLRQAGRNRVATFTWPKTIRTTTEVYGELRFSRLQLLCNE
jgi:glycosyltransferase involved in cell wall biosynthesis